MEEVQVSNHHQNVPTVLQETIVQRKVLSLLQVCVMQVIFVLEDQRLPDHMETVLMEMVMLMAHLNMTQMVFGPQQILEVSALPEDIVKLVPKTNYLAKEDTTTQKLEQKTVYECQKCYPGHYCAGEAQAAMTGKCTAGYYCI
jgi:hypothetical protein